MPYRRPLALAALSAAMGCAIAASAAAENAADVLTIKRVSAGFGSKFKAGYWQPAHLTVVAGPHGARGHLQLVAPDGDQTPVVFRDAARGHIDLAAGQEQTVLLYFKSGPIDAPVTIRLANENGILWSTEIRSLAAPLRSTQELVVSLGPPIGLDEAVATVRRRAEGAVQAANVQAAEMLPDRWWGYEGIDVLVLSTSDAAFLAALSAQQQQAIVLWVQLGGRLVMCVGARGADVTAADGPWVPLIPGTLVEVDALRQRSGLEGFTKVELPFDEPFFQRNRPAVTRLNNVHGEVLLEEISSSTGRPLVIHAAAGLGQATFVGLDLDHPSLKDWKGRIRLVTALVQAGLARHEQSDREVHRGVTHLGYDDLVGQLRAALDQFPGVSLVNFTTVSVLTIVYLLLIGPGDFLLLSRLNLPRHLTWLTLPIVAAGMIALAAAMGGQVHGNRVRLNQAEIVDIDLSTQVARGTVWSHLYSPTTSRFNARLQITTPAGVSSSPEGWLAWQGLPGDSLGGLESRQPTLTRREAYDVNLPGVEPGIDGLTVQVASSKSLAACWWASTSLSTENNLVIDRYGLLAGDFLQPLPISLTDCTLAHGEKLYRLGTVAHAQRVQLAELAPLNLEARLTQRRVEQSKDVSTPWEKDSVDIPRIMQMLMFHDAARGRSYTELTHRYQPQIDLSEHVRLGQAVLVGRAEHPIARLVGGDSSTPLAAADDTNTWTWYRIILPVNSRPLTSDL
jgi:hypothetical protein